MLRKSVIILACVALFPCSLMAHSEIELVPHTSLDSAMTLSYRSDASTNAGEPWYIRGAMLGGEAVPAEQGLVMDELFLTLSHVNEDGVYALLKLGSHGGAEAGFEHAWLGYRIYSGEAAYLNMEAGRMAGKFSPTNLAHADTRLMTESALAFDVFLGRQYNDEGLRLVWGNTQGVLFGIETWQGNAFPATAAEQGGATDVFIQYGKSAEKLSWTLGSWYMQAKADSRNDTRYSGGHAHGIVASEIAEFWFDGDTTLYGVHFDARWQLASQTYLGLNAEWLWQDTEGTLRDDTRRADLVGEASGGWLAPSLTYQRHTVGLRYERLVLNNDFTGVAGEALAELAHLNNTGHNPTRTTLAYRYQLKPSLSLRAEWLKDASLALTENRWLLGLVWQENIWRHE